MNKTQKTETTENTRKSLREAAIALQGARLPIMENREKADQESLHGEVVTIRDFGFLENDKGGDYAVFVVDEYPTSFFFGGKVLTDRLHLLEASGYADDVRAEGLPVLFFKQKTDDGKRTYTAVTLYPEQ